MGMTPSKFHTDLWHNGIKNYRPWAIVGHYLIGTVSACFYTILVMYKYQYLRKKLSVAMLQIANIGQTISVSDIDTYTLLILCKNTPTPYQSNIGSAITNAQFLLSYSVFDFYFFIILRFWAVR